MKFFETSSISGRNVYKVFESAVLLVIDEFTSNVSYMSKLDESVISQTDKSMVNILNESISSQYDISNAKSPKDKELQSQTIEFKNSPNKTVRSFDSPNKTVRSFDSPNKTPRNYKNTSETNKNLNSSNKMNVNIDPFNEANKNSDSLTNNKVSSESYKVLKLYIEEAGYQGNLNKMGIGKPDLFFKISFNDGQTIKTDIKVDAERKFPV